MLDVDEIEPSVGARPLTDLSLFRFFYLFIPYLDGFLLFEQAVL